MLWKKKVSSGTTYTHLLIQHVFCQPKQASQCNFICTTDTVDAVTKNKPLIARATQRFFPL